MGLVWVEAHIYVKISEKPLPCIKSFAWIGNNASFVWPRILVVNLIESSNILNNFDSSIPIQKYACNVRGNNSYYFSVFEASMVSDTKLLTLFSEILKKLETLIKKFISLSSISKSDNPKIINATMKNS